MKSMASIICGGDGTINHESESLSQRSFNDNVYDTRYTPRRKLCQSWFSNTKILEKTWNWSVTNIGEDKDCKNKLQRIILRRSIDMIELLCSCFDKCMKSEKPESSCQAGLINFTIWSLILSHYKYLSKIKQ